MAELAVLWFQIAIIGGNRYPVGALIEARDADELHTVYPLDSVRMNNNSHKEDTDHSHLSVS